MDADSPAGWPDRVPPPGSPDFEAGAVRWLLDVVPPGYREYGVLRTCPAALAVLARHHLAACQRGVREGFRTARTELGPALPAHAIGGVLDAYRSETQRLRAEARSADLLLQALRGAAAGRRARRGRGATGPAGPRPGRGHGH